MNISRRLFVSNRVRSLVYASLFQFHLTMAEGSAMKNAGIDKDPKTLTKDEWKKILTPEQFYVMREQGTERPHTGQYNDFMKNGEYVCGCCGAPLFESDTKFSAHCGWPSFYAAKKVEGSDTPDNSNVERRPDNSHGTTRTEIICKKCGAHLGHVFDDGPQPTGERFCVNSVSLDFKPK